MYAEIRAALTMLGSNHNEKVPYKVHTLLTFIPRKKEEMRDGGKDKERENSLE